jgi:hypothetical protein
MFFETTKWHELSFMFESPPNQPQEPDVSTQKDVFKLRSWVYPKPRSRGARRFSGIVGGSTFLLSSLGLSHVSPGNRWKLGMHALTGNPNELALEEDCLKSK